MRPNYKSVILFLFLTQNIFSATLQDLENSNLNINTQDFKLNTEDCISEVRALKKTYSNFAPSENEILEIKRDTFPLLSNFFKARVKIHHLLSQISKNCVEEVRSLFREMRATEDMIGVLGYQDTQISSKQIKFQDQGIPIIEASKYHPYQTTVENFKFQKGDIIITKGVSMLSSTISSIATEPSLFSHIVFLFQDPKNLNFGTIESYVGLGVDLYPLDFALKNENARLLVLRAKDQSLTVRAHDYIYERVKKSIESGQRISYDYRQDFSNNESLSCEEIAYDAFNTASNGQFKLPYVYSDVNLNDKKFLKSSGLKGGNNMLPADMEVDPRFEIVLDWTDYRLIRENWHKDATMRAVISWINDKNYQLSNTFISSVGKLLWSTRKIDFLWPLSAKLLGISKDFEVGVPGNGIALLSNLNTLEEYLLPTLNREDQNFLNQNGRWMTFLELSKTLEKIRSNDEYNFMHQRKNYFHYFFRNPEVKIDYLHRN
jgi:hypothetical protein